MREVVVPSPLASLPGAVCGPLWNERKDAAELRLRTQYILLFALPLPPHIPAGLALGAPAPGAAASQTPPENQNKYRPKASYEDAKGPNTSQRSKISYFKKYFLKLPVLGV